MLCELSQLLVTYMPKAAVPERGGCTHSNCEGEAAVTQRRAIHVALISMRGNMHQLHVRPPFPSTANKHYGKASSRSCSN
jgi:hypothetical protein